MRKATLAVLMLLLTCAGAASAQVRGKGRVQGVVTDAATSKPIDGAAVTLSPADGGTQPILAKSNAKGRWSALGLTNGQWNIDIAATGYATSRGKVNVSELQMLPAIATKLAAEAPAEEEQPAAVQTSGVPQEIVDAVNLGQEYFAAGKYREAIAEFEKALPALPDNAALHQIAAQAYYKAGDLPNAITLLDAVTAMTPSNHGVVLLLTNLYLENNQLDEAKARLATIPAEAITDPTVYVNIGILFLNKKNPSEALTYLSKAVAMDANRPETFYYRGLANIQLENTKDAKADFEKVLVLAPESPEARDAKQLLDSLK
jgi:Tfp pilus assembly protein PilF